MQVIKVDNRLVVLFGRFEIELYRWVRLLLISFEANEEGWTFALCLILGIFITRKPRGWNRTARRVIKFNVCDGALFWCLWRDDHEWHRGDWRHRSFRPIDFLLGRERLIDDYTAPSFSATLSLPKAIIRPRSRTRNARSSARAGRSVASRNG